MGVPFDVAVAVVAVAASGVNRVVVAALMLLLVMVVLSGDVIIVSFGTGVIRSAAAANVPSAFFLHVLNLSENIFEACCPTNAEDEETDGDKDDAVEGGGEEEEGGGSGNDEEREDDAILMLPLDCEIDASSVFITTVAASAVDDWPPRDSCVATGRVDDDDDDDDD
jgi:hypothetical protein